MAEESEPERQAGAKTVNQEVCLIPEEYPRQLQRAAALQLPGIISQQDGY